MPSTTLQHPMNTYRPPVEIPKWLIVLRDGKTIRFRDLKTLRDFQRAECGDKMDPPPLGGMLKMVNKHLNDTDVYILQNSAGDELHFCRANFRHKAGYIQGVKKERANERMS